LSSSFEQNTQIPSDALELSEANECHVQSDLGPLLVYSVGITGRDIPHEWNEVRLALEMQVYFKIR
jgi:hypothetical protein